MMELRVALFILHGCVRESTNTSSRSALQNSSAINDTEDLPVDNKMNNISIAFLSSLLFMGALGTFLNISTVIIIGFGRRITKEVKIQLINMALTDLLLALMTVSNVIMASLYFNKCVWSFDSSGVWTRVNLWYASPLCSASISIERAFIIYFPLSVYRYTKTHKILVACVIWVIAVTSSFTGHFDYNYITLIKFIIPTVIIVICYSAVFAKLYFRTNSQLQLHSSNHRYKQVKKLQTMLAVDAALTLLTWIPFVIRYGSLKGTLYIDYETVDFVLYLLVTTNAFSTPTIYFIFNDNFRKDTKDIFNLLRCKKIPARPRSSQKISQQSTVSKLTELRCAEEIFAITNRRGALKSQSWTTAK
ncbi:histamine H2 receptor-like [Watersipora subatra]|uniref:histamine H2 receptor-like n=1 Tax=Watersipora subatra TaxID=2589382 RepID=UPI00355BCD4A